VKKSLVVLIGIVLMALLLPIASFSNAFAKDIQTCPLITLSVPEACPDYREFRPFPPVMMVNNELEMAFIVQEGQRGTNEFILVLAVAQLNPDATFIFAIQHSLINTEDP